MLLLLPHKKIHSLPQQAEAMPHAKDPRDYDEAIMMSTPPKHSKAAEVFCSLPQHAKAHAEDTSMAGIDAPKLTKHDAAEYDSEALASMRRS